MPPSDPPLDRGDAEHAFLRLLFAEAPPEAFEDPVDAARQAGATAEELEHLQEDMVVALRIRATLAERRRREVELSALNETAADLTAMRDLGRVLQAIVRRARALLGTDTSYLTLIDEDQGDTYMRVTDGISRVEFKELRLELGTGLGGLVAQSRSPYTTADYATDERFAHTRTIDDAVTREGLTAILGVPILLGEEVIGVLFAADRRERLFSNREVALLSAFAAHAAVAIENARLFQEAEAAVRDLNEAYTIISAHSQAVERAASSHERLTRIVLEGGGVDDVAEAIAELFAGSLLVVAGDGRILARAGGAEDAWLDDAARGQVEEARNEGRTLRVGADDGGARFISPVLAGTEHLGTLLLWPSAEPDEADLRTLERAGLVTALLLLNQRSVAEAEQRVQGELLSELLTADDNDAEGLRQRAQLLGTDLDRPHAVIVARAPQVARHHAASAAAALAAELGGMGGSNQGDMVLVVPAADAGEVAAGAGRRLSGVLGGCVTAGAAGPVTGVTAIPDAYGEAARCLRVLVALGRTGETATPADLGAYSLLLSQLGRQDLARFIRRTIGPLLDYDEQRGTSLVATLEAYFTHGGNLARTAEALHIHVNTLYQRMDRIGRLVGADWVEPDRALQLHLAVTFERLQHAI
jgi:sugar diacid utilization regulator/GAF domain-containing protein